MISYRDKHVKSLKVNNDIKFKYFQLALYFFESKCWSYLIKL